MKIYEHLYGNNQIKVNEYDSALDRTEYTQDDLINIYPELEYDEFMGFGGALTESSAYCYSLLSEEDKKQFVEDYFGKNGLGYTNARLHIDSCDFCLSNYCAKESENSEFTLERDEKYIIPLLYDVEKVRKLRYLVSPWSPPAYMKDTKKRNGGGKLLHEYYSAWAEHYCHYIEEYLKMGFDIEYLTVQNEPLASHTWDCCVYTTEEEGEFLSDYLYPEMKKRGLDGIRRLVWDYNRVRLYERLRNIVDYVKNKESVSGVAYHWYHGDHYEQIKMVHDRYPDMLSVFSEGCVEYSRFGVGAETEHAEKYAYNILYCLKNGCNLFFDWNVLLDSKGGPNHVGNMCASPIMLDENNSPIKHPSYYIIGSFSKHIKPGAHRIALSSFTDELDHVAFKNPNGQITVVVLNRREKDIPMKLRLNSHYCNFTVRSKSVVTFTI